MAGFCVKAVVSPSSQSKRVLCDAAKQGGHGEKTYKGWVGSKLHSTSCILAAYWRNIKGGLKKISKPVKIAWNPRRMANTKLAMNTLGMRQGFFFPFAGFNCFNFFTVASKSFSTGDGFASSKARNFENSNSAFFTAASCDIFPA